MARCCRWGQRQKKRRLNAIPNDAASPVPLIRVKTNRTRAAVSLACSWSQPVSQDAITVPACECTMFFECTLTLRPYSGTEAAAAQSYHHQAICKHRRIHMFLSEICQKYATFLSQQAIVNADTICISNLNNVAWSDSGRSNYSGHDHSESCTNIS